MLASFVHPVDESPCTDLGPCTVQGPNFAHRVGVFPKRIVYTSLSHIQMGPRTVREPKSMAPCAVSCPSPS